MSSEFKWLVNPSDKDFEFQHDSKIYEVPARSQKLMLAGAADHGMKRSFYLTDPQFKEDGTIASGGNDVMRRCEVRDADVVNQVGFNQPIMVEKSKDDVSDVVSLSIDPSKPIKRVIRRRGNLNEESEDVGVNS